MSFLFIQKIFVSSFHYPVSSYPILRINLYITINLFNSLRILILYFLQYGTEEVINLRKQYDDLRDQLKQEQELRSREKIDLQAALDHQLNKNADLQGENKKQFLEIDRINNYLNNLEVKYAEKEKIEMQHLYDKARQEETAAEASATITSLKKTIERSESNYITT